MKYQKEVLELLKSIIIHHVLTNTKNDIEKTLQTISDILNKKHTHL